MDEEAHRSAARQPISAQDLGRLIRRFVRVFDSGDLGNVDTADALSALADHLQSLGSIAVSDLDIRRKPARKSVRLDRSNLDRLSISEVRHLISDDSLSKGQLTELARIRFGIPEARLRRLPMAQVIEAIEAAGAHEESLDIIERNAETSARSRTS